MIRARTGARTSAATERPRGCAERGASRGGAARAGPGHDHDPYFSLTVTFSAPVLPNTSGVYISSTLVGGTTKLPSDVARAT